LGRAVARLHDRRARDRLVLLIKGGDAVRQPAKPTRCRAEDRGIHWSAGTGCRTGLGAFLWPPNKPRKIPLSKFLSVDGLFYAGTRKARRSIVSIMKFPELRSAGALSRARADAASFRDPARRAPPQSGRGLGFGARRHRTRAFERRALRSSTMNLRLQIVREPAGSWTVRSLANGPVAHLPSLAASVDYARRECAAAAATIEFIIDGLYAVAHQPDGWPRQLVPSIEAATEATPRFSHGMTGRREGVATDHRFYREAASAVCGSSSRFIAIRAWAMRLMTAAASGLVATNRSKSPLRSTSSRQ
jgi:hypothetical protein